METKKEIAEKIRNSFVVVHQKMLEINTKFKQSNDVEERISLEVEYARLKGKSEGLIEAYDMLIGYHR